MEQYGKLEQGLGYYDLTHADIEELFSFEKDQWLIHMIDGKNNEKYLFDNHCRMYIFSQYNCQIQVGLPGQVKRVIRNYSRKSPVKFPPSRWRLSNELIDAIKLIHNYSDVGTYMTFVLSKLI
jgi:hypothetical protein